jgi:hypothetical protein
VYIACTGKMKGAQKYLVGKPKRKEPLRRYRSLWEDNIKIDHIEMGWKNIDWIHPVQDKDQCFCEYDNEPSGFMKCWEFLE